MNFAKWLRVEQPWLQNGYKFWIGLLLKTACKLQAFEFTGVTDGARTHDNRNHNTVHEHLLLLTTKT